METLEVNFKSVFENLPGKVILLLPNPPFFTIAGASNGYCKAASFTRKEIVGKNLREVFDERLSAFFKQAAISEVMDSLEYVVHNRKKHSLSFAGVDNDAPGNKNKHIKVTHIPVLSKEGEVLYVIHRLRRSRKVIESKPASQQFNGISGNEELYVVINQAPVAMGILRGKDMIVEIANKHLLELWGKSSDIVGLPVLKALPEIIGQPFPQLLANVYETGVEYHGFESEATLMRRGQLTKSYFNYVYSPVKDSNGSVNGIMMIAADVTGLVNAKQALEESEKRYRDLIAGATVATAVYSGKDMKILLANEAMIKLWGKDASVIGKPLREALPELQGQPFLPLLENVYKTGVTYHSKEDRAELVVDGHLQTFYFNFTYKALCDVSGKIYGVLNMAVDVSDTVKAKMRINETEERWRMALNSAELGTWDYYPMTDELICSVRTKELFGLSAEAPVSFERLIDAIHVRDREKVKNTIEQAMASPSLSNSYRVEYEVLGIEDKKSRWQRATGLIFFNEEGVAYRINGTVLDITERKRIEEALEERVNSRTIELLDANKELERSNHELEQYAYVASHDLQEPLRKILVYSDLLKNATGNYSGVDAARLDKIISSAQRMSHLIKDLLNFSRLLKTENIFSPVDLNIVTKNILDDFELKTQETGAIFEIGPLPVVEASAQQMNQLFYNLISNALKFRRDGVPPRIVINAKLLARKEIERFSDLNPSLIYFDLSITDNGIGFNPKYTTHIFEIFKRLHTRAKFDGTGIGLALCRKIIRNHRGEIYAESIEGKGSVFHVLLPVKQNAAEGD